jgi:hypothetical protein
MFLKREQHLILQNCISRNMSEYLAPEAVCLFRGVAKPEKDEPCGPHIRE